MSYIDFRNIRAEILPPADRFSDSTARIFAEVSESNTIPRQWKKIEIAGGRMADPWQLLPGRLYELAKIAAGGAIKLNGRTVSGSQFLAAFEKAVYPKQKP